MVEHIQNGTALNWNVIIPAAFSFLGLVVTSIVAAYVAKVRSTVAEIHTAVNSERTAMFEKLRELTAEILRISTEKATLTAEASAQKQKDKPAA